MLDAAWLAVRQTEEALKNGRLEEAERILQLPVARAHRRTSELLTLLARGYVERGERYLRLDDAEGAWRDLLQAEKLGTAEKSCDRLRQTLVGLGMAELRALLAAGETGRAEEALVTLRQRGARSPELQVLEEALRNWLAAVDLANRGEWALALEAAGRARRVLTANKALEDYHAVLVQRSETFPVLLGKLLNAVDGARWPEVIEIAEQALAVAPQHPEARAMRARAWKAVEPPTLSVAPATVEPADPTYAVDFWDLTNRQDWAACESVQRGIASPHFVPGPLASNEDAVYQWTKLVAGAYLDPPGALAAACR